MLALGRAEWNTVNFTLSVEGCEWCEVCELPLRRKRRVGTSASLLMGLLAGMNLARSRVQTT